VRRLVLSLIAVLTITGCERGDHPSNIGKPAPQFAVTDGTQTIDLGKLRGKVVVLNLWATWCTPCLQELPSLIKLHHDMPDLDIVAVSMDEDDTVYREFLTKRGVDFTTVRDPSQKINALYGTAQIPETYVIDRQGVLRRKFVSAQNWTTPEIEKYLAHL